MNFGLSESQQILRSNARKFFANECPPAEVRRIMETETAFDAGLYAKIAEQGFTGLLFPEQYGGLGLGRIEMAVLLEEMGKALVPGPYFSTVFLSGTVIDAAGSHEQKEKYLQPLAEGSARAALAMLEEPSASWDPAAVRMTASADGLLTGRKVFVQDAAVADLLVVVAREAATGELALYAVDATKAASVTPMRGMDLTRRISAVTFDRTPGDLLAAGAAAEKALESALQTATVALSAELTGVMQRAMDLSVDYAKARKQFGKPIGSYQAVQHQCADMYLWTESSRSAVLYAAWALDNRAPDAAKAVSIAKMYTSDAGREIGSRAIQVHGGNGFTWENDCHLCFRRAKVSETMLGDPSYHREKIAQLVIDAVEAGGSTEVEETVFVSAL
jgi:alkylation response protein AidB-like acyl-CoA dehydrogenase